jgi:hypothetical protein
METQCYLGAVANQVKRARHGGMCRRSAGGFEWQCCSESECRCLLRRLGRSLGGWRYDGMKVRGGSGVRLVLTSSLRVFSTTRLRARGSFETVSAPCQSIFFDKRPPTILHTPSNLQYSILRYPTPLLRPPNARQEPLLAFFHLQSSRQDSANSKLVRKLPTEPQREPPYFPQSL